MKFLHQGEEDAFQKVAQDWNGLLEELMISINLFVVVWNTFLDFCDNHEVCSVSKKKKAAPFLTPP